MLPRTFVSVVTLFQNHYHDVLMSAMASQITSLAIVYSTVYSAADQRKHQSSASLSFVRGIHRWPMNSLHKGPVTRKTFPFDDVIMYSVLLICRGNFSSYKSRKTPQSFVSANLTNIYIYIYNRDISRVYNTHVIWTKYTHLLRTKDMYTPQLLILISLLVMISPHFSAQRIFIQILSHLNSCYTYSVTK